MSVEPAPATSTDPSPVRRLLPVLPPVICTVLLTGGVLGLLPSLVATCAAIAVAAAVYTTQLVRTSLTIHGAYHSFGPCRGAGFVCLAVFAGGITALAVAAAQYSGAQRPDTPHSEHLAARFGTGGLLVAAVLYSVGMLLLPGAAPSFVARLRRALDGLGLGISFLFSAWVVVIAPDGRGSGLSVWVGLTTCAALALAVVTGLRAVRYRAAARLCCSGSGASLCGLAGLALVLTGSVGPVWLPLIGGCLVYGPMLSSGAARRYASTPDEPRPAERDGTFAGYPIMAIPITMVLIAALYHLITVHTFDTTSAALGCAVVAALTARETFGVFDVRRYARQLSVQETHFRALVAGSSDVTMVLDSALMVRWQSPAAARQFGLSDQDALHRPFTSLLHPDDADPVREQLVAVLACGGTRAVLIPARLRDGFGHYRDTESTLNDLRRVPEVGGLVVHLRDVGERRELERTLHRMAFTDQLTGLANRRELLRGLTAMRAVPGQPGALLVIDLDGFTGVNDVRGHEVGDAVLIEAARRVRTGVGESDLAARLASDEFAVATAVPPVQAYALANRLLTVLGESYQLPGATVHLTASVGLSELAGAASVSDVLGRAELALRRARQLRRGRIEWYDEVLESSVVRRLTLEQELPGVVARGELDLAYLPVLDLVERHPVGAEALLRWRHPKLGTIEAGEFIPVAEDLGLVYEIGEWAIQRGCRQLSGWLRDGHDIWLTVNLSSRQLTVPNLVATVRTALESHQVPAERLVLDTTEAALSADTQGAVTQLAGLRALGVRTALSRFGTGATPLAHLRRLPIDILKVDRVIYAEPAGRADSTTPIMDVVVGLARRLGLEIMAEGLEDEGHLESVRGAGCRYGQGYLFGRPQPAERFEAFLATSRAST